MALHTRHVNPKQLHYKNKKLVCNNNYCKLLPHYEEEPLSRTVAVIFNSFYPSQLNPALWLKRQQKHFRYFPPSNDPSCKIRTRTGLLLPLFKASSSGQVWTRPTWQIRREWKLFSSSLLLLFQLWMQLFSSPASNTSFSPVCRIAFIPTTCLLIATICASLWLKSVSFTFTAVECGSCQSSDKTTRGLQIVGENWSIHLD